jgi:dTDP-4-amino-4,6-dideoxygalactose transaminase
MVYYPIPQDKLPVYLGQYPEFPTSNKLSGQVLSLPIWPEISDEVQVLIVKELARALHE